MVVGGWSLPQEQCTPPSCDCECLLGYHHLHGLAPTIFDPSISYHPNVPSGSAFITLSPRSQHKQSRNASAPSRPTAGAPCSELPDANRPAGQRRRSPGRRRARPPPRRRAGRHPHGRSRSRTPGRRTYARAVRGRRLVLGGCMSAAPITLDHQLGIREHMPPDPPGRPPVPLRGWVGQHQEELAETACAAPASPCAR